MKILLVFIKTLREMRRDWMTLSLTLAFAPFFVFAYWIFTAGGSTSYNVLVFNQDRGAAGAEAVAAIRSITYANGQPILRTTLVGEGAAAKAEAEGVLRDRGAAAFVVIPEDFSAALQALSGGDRSAATQITFGGDLTNPYYMLAANLTIAAIDGYVTEVTGQQPLVQYTEEALGASAARTEFELYVPGVIILAVILLIFLAAMTLAREVEAGTLRRLQLTPLSSFDMLGGITLALVCIGVIGMLITLASALAMGFRSQGPLWLAILIAALTSLSVIGLGLIVACFSRTVSQAFILANFPLAFFMFFTGAMFPIPKVVLFNLSGREIGLYDLLPPTHAVVALGKVMTLGAGAGEIGYELGALLLLSVLYFGLGVWLFQKRQLR